MKIPQADIAKFWARVKKSKDCWEWAAGKDTQTYGRFRFAGQNISAHRFSWILANGDIKPSHLFVLHKCDNPACVNPSHLFLGTAADNYWDSRRKKRQPRGPKRISAAQAAKLLNMSLDYIYRLIWVGKLPSKKVDGKWLVLEQAVEERLACKP